MLPVDFLIVGGGVAGLRAAIGLAAAGRVLILTKAAPAESNTGYAQGGIAAAVGDDDTPALHAADTVRAASSPKIGRRARQHRRVGRGSTCSPSLASVVFTNATGGVRWTGSR